MLRRSRGGKFRFRTWLRTNSPSFISDRIGKGSADCGDHEWYNHDGLEDRCYHCKVGVRPHGAQTHGPPP